MLISHNSDKDIQVKKHNKVKVKKQNFPNVETLVRYMNVSTNIASLNINFIKFC